MADFQRLQGWVSACLVTLHALAGVNGAGKSMLMVVLSGAYDHDSGEILLDGESVSIRSPRDAKWLGIHLVQQEVDAVLVPGLSVAGNIMLDRLVDVGQLFIARPGRYWDSWMSHWMRASVSIGVAWRKNSISCWQERFLIIAVFLSLMNPLLRWTSKKTSGCLPWFVVCKITALAWFLFPTVFTNSARFATS
ncbi:ribose ABC transporter ATP-binding protein [Erwinia tracheiphila PSU-1]|nr:ribose ABC transporter ATP-binding protein [Erwinia tracheiphila PSU-1]